MRGHTDLKLDIDSRCILLVDNHQPAIHKLGSNNVMVLVNKKAF